MPAVSKLALFAVLCCGLPVRGATVTIEKVMRTSGNSIFNRDAALTDTVPGRPEPFVFWSESDPLPPAVNESGEVVFRALSASRFSVNSGGEFGLYVKRPTLPLDVLVDTTLDGTGAPNFPVPGHPGFRFTQFDAPLLNNAGDVVFWASFRELVSPFTNASGFFSVPTTGGPIVNIVDTLDTVPGHPATSQFISFIFTFKRPSDFAASVNDFGDVVYWGQFCVAGPTCALADRQNGIFGTTVAGGAGIRLADSTRDICPTDIPFGLTCDGALDEGFWEIRPEIAINNAGIVAFHGAILRSPPTLCCRGTFSVPVTGGAPTTVAFRVQTAPKATPTAPASQYLDRFDDNDINEAGTYLFLPLLSAPGTVQRFGLFAGNVDGSLPHVNVVDTLVGNGLVVPGDITGAEFTTITMAPINEAGQLGFYAAIRNSGTPNNQGIYARDTSGGPITLVMDAQVTPPGQPAGAKITSFQGRSAAINDDGHMTFWGSGIRPADGGGIESLLGLYFYDACAEEVARIADSTTALSELGVAFGGFPGSSQFMLFQSGEARSGHYRSINNSSDVAFLAKFSNFGLGHYIAHITPASTGALNITCPPDATVECGDDTSAVATGQPSVCSQNPATVSSSDSSAPGCGATETITRTWTADDGVNPPVSCDQIITVVDTTPPDIVGVPNDETVPCENLPPPADPTVSDGCDPNPSLVLEETVTTGDCAGELMIVREWTATDACGNVSTRCQIVTVLEDASAPMLTVPGDVTVECGDSTDPSNTGEAGATADCRGDATVTYTDTTFPGSCGGEEIITRTWMAEDSCGNVASGDQFITVRDTTRPDLTLPDDTTVECNTDSSPAVTGFATADDACDGPAVPVTYSDVVEVGDCPQESVIRRTWSATDACDNTASDAQAVSVVDTTAPVLTVDTTPITVVDADCGGDEDAALPTATATDNCDPAPVVGGFPPGPFPAGDTTSVLFTATDACGNSSSESVAVTVLHGANIAIEANQHTVGSGTFPGSDKEPLVGIEVCAYDKSDGSCARDTCGGISHQYYECIAATCPAAGCCTTDVNGECTINLPPGDYVVISNDATKTVLPDPLGVSASDLLCGETKQKHLQQIVRVDGKKLPGKTRIETGSLLLIIEPEYVLWDQAEQPYPFVFESVGEWGVTVTVTPPEGFVADYEALTADVDNELESVQFVVTEVGSDLVPTQTEFHIVHNGERRVVRSNVDIRLTPSYARERGFDVQQLRSRGLIHEPQDGATPREMHRGK
jgi:hypothetical protein